MGGDIQVESRVDEGSTFRFSTILRRSEGDSGAAAPIRRLSGVRILGIVAHAMSRAILERQLAPEGCDIEVADSARAGLARYRAMLAQDRPPAAVVIDQVLDDHDGLWLAAAIRESAAPPPSVILLASLACELRDEEIALVDRVIAKPAKTQILVRALAALTQQGRPSTPSDSSSSYEAAPALLGTRVLLAEDHLGQSEARLPASPAHGRSRCKSPPTESRFCPRSPKGTSM